MDLLPRRIVPVASEPAPKLGFGTKRPAVRLAQLVTAQFPAVRICPLLCRIQPYLIKATPLRGVAGRFRPRRVTTPEVIITRSPETDSSRAPGTVRDLQTAG